MHTKEFCRVKNLRELNFYRTNTVSRKISIGKIFDFVMDFLFFFSFSKKRIYSSIQYHRWLVTILVTTYTRPRVYVFTRVLAVFMEFKFWPVLGTS